MINKLIEFSLKNRLLILTLGTILLVAGAYISSDMDVDIFPDLNAPTVVVMTEAHGMAPEEVERMVTFQIETAVNGAANIRRVRSTSSMGFSIVWVEFDWGTDIYDARQTVSEKLIAVQGSLPEGTGTPTIAPQASLLGEVFMFSISSDSLSPLELRTFAEWNLRPRILSVGGVAQVTIIGGDVKEYQVKADPHKMRYYNVSLDELIETLQESNSNATGGFIDEYGNNYIIRGMVRSTDVDEMSNNVIKVVDDFPIKVEDVAKIEVASAPKIGDASYRGEKAVIVTVTKQPGINTIKLNEMLEKEVKNIASKQDLGVKFNMDIFNQASFIQIAIDNVKNAIMEGALLVIIILFVFLMNVRTTIISLLAIPLSLIVSIIMLKIFGFTINTMSLGGMAIAIGSLVDDAIIDVENVYKRLRQNAHLPDNEKQSNFRVIYDASREIRSSILNATFIIIVAFIPLFFLSGMEGLMLRPLGISYIVSLFASLIVAVTITPVLCNLMLTNKEKLQKREKESWLVEKIQAAYKSTLSKLMKKEQLVLISSLILLAGTLALFFTFGRSFLPPFNEGSLAINLVAKPGISLEESNKIGVEAEKLLLTIPEVITTSRKTGRAELAEHSFGVNTSEVEVPFVLEDRSRSEFLKEVREKLNTIPGIMVEVGQPISHRIDHMLSGSRSNIAIKLFGEELPMMFSIANKIKGKISGIEGVADLSVEQQVEIPQIKIIPKRDILAKYGIRLNEFHEYINSAFQGVKVSDVFEGEKSFDLVLRFDEEFRNTKEALENAFIDTYNGQKIPLSYVANVVSSTGPNSVSRENVQRKIVVNVNIADRDLRSVVNDIQNKINSEIQLPEDYWIEFGGQFESEAKASRILFFTSIVAIFIIFLILYQEFKNLKTATIILINLPLALIGGVISIWVDNSIVSIPSIIGFITLFGIATRNGILLVSRYNALREEGHDLDYSILHGSLDRISPILMTALTAALALLPLALAGDKPGNEIQSPMAIVILGGLISSTILNLYVIPLAYKKLYKNQIGA